MYVDVCGSGGCSRVTEMVPLQVTVAPHPLSGGKKGRSMTRPSDRNGTLDDNNTHMGTFFSTMCFRTCSRHKVNH